MKYLFIVVVVLCLYNHATAQSIKFPVGKKFTVNTSYTNLAEVTMMDTHMQMHNDASQQLQLELTAKNTNGYTLMMTPVHIVSLFSLNGMEQKFDSDSLKDQNNQMYAKIINLINKPQEIVIENNITIKNSQMAGLSPTGLQDDASKYFLTVSVSNLHNGYHWSDSTSNESSKVVNQYTILQITDATVEVYVNSDYQIHHSVEQSGMTMVQNLKGYSTGKRIYTKQDGLLKEESLDMDISGSTESQEMSSPLTMKLKLKSTIN